MAALVAYPVAGFSSIVTRMYKRYYSDRDNRAFDTEEECRNHELSIEAVEHLCGGRKPNEFFSPGYDDEVASDFLSEEIKEKVSERYQMRSGFVDIVFGNIRFSEFVQYRGEFKKLFDLASDIQKYIDAAQKIEKFIEERN